MPGGGSGMPMQVTNKATRKVLALRLGILGPNEIRNMSVIKSEQGEQLGITNEQVLEKTGEPCEKGIHDPRMGTTDRDRKCATCHCDATHCPGHFGHIELAKPVFHPGYVTDIRKVLRCICYSCGKLRLRDKEKRDKIAKIKNPKVRFRQLLELCSKYKECKEDKLDPLRPGCGNKVQPNYRASGLKIIREEVGDFGNDAPGNSYDPKRLLLPEEAREILSKMSDDEITLLGFSPTQSRPEWMVIKTLAVCPPPVRPSVQAGDGARSEDDLTFAYKEIIRTNNELRRYDNSGQDQGSIQEIVSTLQLQVATIMDNNNPEAGNKAKHKDGRAIKDVRARLKGKEGRVRGNLMGKRVDFSARTVITPDPILQLDQLGVPEGIAKNLTVPEHVTLGNLHVMKQLVKNGPTKWPGAKYIIRHDEKQIDLSQIRNLADADLYPGCIVERQVRDGDFVVFNRQPSLHKMSLMGHRVKVLPFMTFRLNLSVTSPYNADFDGDEMNMHVPQSFETKAEVKEIMHVPKQVVAPKNNKPVMGIVQDSLLGIYLFTKRDTFIEMDVVMNLLMWLDYNGKLPPPAIIKPRPLWTGKQIISLVIPKVNLKRSPCLGSRDGCCKQNPNLEHACRCDANVLVKNGELLYGVLNKGIVGASGGGLVHIVWRDHGPEANRDFMSNAQNVINNWLYLNGFTVGVQDMIATEQTNKQIEDIIKRKRRNVQRIMQKSVRGQLEIIPGKTMLETFEAAVNTELRAALDTSGNAALKNLRSDNRLQNMVDSGSKGGKMNISQIMACVGQQNVEGKRIPFGFNRRSLPHFSKDDYGPESKGFVANCYVAGLTPQEMYFHAMGGREGLIDTAVKTADTGYIQRRLIKALEDVQVKYDGTVRTSRDQVIQFIYGEDGMAAEFIEDLSIPLLKMDDKKLKKQFEYFQGCDQDAEKMVKLRQNLDEETMEECLQEQGSLEEMTQLLQEEFDQIKRDRDELRGYTAGCGDKTHLAVNVPRLIWNAKEKFGIKPRTTSDLSPDYVIKRTKELLENGINVYQQPRLDVSPLFQQANIDATRHCKIYLRHLLAAKHVIQRENLTRESFDWLIGEIQCRFERSMVHPGEMVGSIGAQSMGEPATQMTLNTFHLAGVASKNVTLGVPRLKEIINVATTIKTPTLTIFVAEPWHKDGDVAKELGDQIEHTTLSQIVSSSAIYYDPNPQSTIISADSDLIDLHNMLLDAEGQGTNDDLSPWVLRFEIDQEKLASSGMTTKEIQKVIESNMDMDSQQLNIIKSPDNAAEKKLIFRMNLPDLEGEGNETTAMYLSKVEQHLLNDFDPQRKMTNTGEAQYDPETGEMSERKDVFIIETDGVALKEVLAIEKVDQARTTSNNIREILTVLGIEAARYSLLHELRVVLGSYEIYVNYRHLGTLCDIMTTRGHLMAITRHGINRVDSGALRKCSFEETVEILLEASMHAEVDPLSGVTENIIMGQLAPYGTGSFDVMVDTDMLKEASAVEDQVVDYSDFFSGGGTGQYDQNVAGGSTPFIDSPIVQPAGQSVWEANTPGYNNPYFTPMNRAADSPVPQQPNGGQTNAYQTTQIISDQVGGSSPIYAMTPARQGVQPNMTSGYSPTNNTPGYMVAAGRTPGYGNGSYSPAYQGRGTAGGYGGGASPAYAPYSGGMGYGGASPGYNPRPMGGQGSTPAYSYQPRAGQGSAPTPAYNQSRPTPGGGDSNANNNQNGDSQNN